MEWFEDHQWSDGELATLTPEEQKDAMREWFRANYENPANRTPYESGVGYVWIWGGPFEASHELQDRFSGVVPLEVILGLAAELDKESTEWAPTERPDDYESFYIDALQDASGFSHRFADAILDIETVLKSEIAAPVEGFLFRQMYVAVITALEAYLSEAFVGIVIANKVLLQKFVESTPEFQNAKINLADIYSILAELEKRSADYMADVVWHNLPKVKAMYADTLGVQFGEIGDLMKAVGKRHDIVHRNGKTKTGHEWQIAREDVEALIAACERLVSYVDGQLPVLDVVEEHG